MRTQKDPYVDEAKRTLHKVKLAMKHKAIAIRSEAEKYQSPPEKQS